VTAPNQSWVADITSVHLPTTFVYLACVLDASSRRCVGWKLSRQINTPLTLDALELALTQRRPNADPTPTDAWADSPFGSRRPVCESRLCRPPGTGGGAREHVGQGQSLRHCQSRELLQDAQTRDGLITNDKFCFIHSRRLLLSWRRTGALRREDTPVTAKQAEQAGDQDETEHQTGVASAPKCSARRRRATPLGSRLSPPPAVGALTGGQ